MFDLASSDQNAADALRRWLPDTFFGISLAHILSDDSLMFSNRVAQPLIVAATLATWEALKNFVPRPSLIAGYSVGEIAAYGVAGALTAADAINLAASRARLMDDCVDVSCGQSMIAVSGLRKDVMTELAQRHGLYIAIETDDDSFVVGGLSSQIVEVERTASQLGGRSNLLSVKIASHTPLMHGALIPFADVLRNSNFGDPEIPVLSGIDGSPVYKKQRALLTLTRQLTEKICWVNCMDACAEAGITIVLELGPGSALQRMWRKRHPRIECRSGAALRTLQGIATWFARV